MSPGLRRGRQEAGSEGMREEVEVGRRETHLRRGGLDGVGTGSTKELVESEAGSKSRGGAGDAGAEGGKREGGAGLRGGGRGQRPVRGGGQRVTPRTGPPPIEGSSLR